MHPNKVSPPPTELTVLELFCGIGGFAAAVAGLPVRVVAAIDQSPAALAVYRLNFPGHEVRQRDLERVDASELVGFGADLWWLSPPCQPYSVRGRGQDLDDPRARSLLCLISILASLPADQLPRSIALENVPGFARSRARQLLSDVLGERGYSWCERQLCPTDLGVPSRRPRYYLVASRAPLTALPPRPARPQLPLRDYLDNALDAPRLAALSVPPEVLARFGDGFRILDPADDKAYTTCFTGGYGKSLMYAGSYLQTAAGVRRFAPQELARLLHFPGGFRFPETLSLRKRWQLLGNSLSVVAVREVLQLLGLCAPPTEQGVCTEHTTFGG